MRQLVFLRPGALEWREVADASLEDDRDALVEPVAATTCDLDRLVLRGETPLSGPLALGHECVARVVDVGDAVKTVRPGDIVGVPWHISCWRCDRCHAGVPTSCRELPFAMFGLPVGGEWGSMFSELIRVPNADQALVVLPTGVTAETLASISDNLPAAWEVTAPALAHHPGAEVLIMGGSGSIALYAVAFALACGASRVDYVDTDATRLATAATIGATAIETQPPGRMDDEYPVTVDATAHDERGLACALRSVAPEGHCSTIGIFFRDVTIPLFDMYRTGVTFHAGKSNARIAMPAVLDLVSAGRIDPAVVNGAIEPWDAMPDVLSDPPMKPVFLRDADGA